MTPLELFIVLVVLAFIGGIRAARGTDSLWGFASGIEFVALGVALGPHLLGVVTRSAASEFEELWIMALGWLLAVRGAHFGAERGLTLLSLIGSVIASAACCGVVFGAVLFMARRWHFEDPMLLALGLSAVCAESSSGGHGSLPTAGQSVGSVAARWTQGTELVPVLVLACMTPGAMSLPFAVPEAWTGLLLSIGLGFVLGSTVTALIGVHFEPGELWPLLLGSILLVVGTALRFDLPAVTPAFVLGITVATLSRHRDTVRALVYSTEKQLLLPCLLLAGVTLMWPETPREWLLIATALGSRFACKLLLGLLVAHGEGAPGRLSVGRELLRGSGVNIAIGLVIFLRQADSPGRNVLVAAVLSVVLGEIVAPRRALVRKSEPPTTSPLPSAHEPLPAAGATDADR